nr:hypothetical protein [Tanacetum cinerariifolium]
MFVALMSHPSRIFSASVSSSYVLSLTVAGVVAVSGTVNMPYLKGADNRPPMLDKTQYSSWASCMLLYIRGKENEKLLVDSVLNRPFKYGIVTVPETATTPATVRDRTYDELTDAEKIREGNGGTSTAGQEKEKAMLTKALESGMVLDEEKITFLVDNGDAITISQQSQEIPTLASFQTDDLDAFDSDCDEAPSDSAVLMAMLSAYDSDVLS